MYIEYNRDLDVITLWSERGPPLMDLNRHEAEALFHNLASFLGKEIVADLE